MQRFVAFAGVTAMVWATGCSPKSSPASEAEDKEVAEGETGADGAPENPGEGETAKEPDAPKGKPDPRAKALVLKGGQLLSLSGDGKTSMVASTPRAQSCDFDDAHGVTWLVTTSSVEYYDASDDAVHQVVSAIDMPREEGGEDEMIDALPFPIVWRVLAASSDGAGPVKVAGNADELEDCVGLEITVGAEPKLGAVAVGLGDREYYCFGDEAEPPFDISGFAEAAAYEGAKLEGSDDLKELAQRRAGRPSSASSPQSTPEAPAIEVDRSQCKESPEDCGKATYVGGDRLWEVIVGNDRGDFYHEQTALFDAKTGEYWDPATDTRTKPPALPSASSDLEASPDGTWAVVWGEHPKVIDLVEAKVVGDFSGVLCGWP